jgi:hypothetical protein
MPVSKHRDNSLQTSDQNQITADAWEAVINQISPQLFFADLVAIA